MGNAESSQPFIQSNDTLTELISNGSMEEILDYVNEHNSLNHPEVLNYGARNKSVDVLELLISMGYPYLADKNGNTPLHISCKLGYIKHTLLLLESASFLGKTIDSLKSERNAKGKKPYDVAKDEEIKKLVECITSEGSSVVSGWCTNAIVKGVCRTAQKRENIRMVYIEQNSKLYFIQYNPDIISSIRIFAVDFSHQIPILTGPVETLSVIKKDITSIYDLDPISADDLFLFASIFHMVNHHPIHRIKQFVEVMIAVKNGKKLKSDQLLVYTEQLKSITLDRQIVPSVTKTVHPITSSHSAANTVQPNTSSNTLSENNLCHFLFINKVKNGSSGVARTFVPRSAVYVCICESVSSGWWNVTKKALCIAFKSSSESQSSNFRVFLVEIERIIVSKYAITLFGPMADEQIIREYPNVTDVNILLNVSVDTIIDVIKVCTMIYEESELDSMINKGNTGVLNCIVNVLKSLYGDPSHTPVNSKYLASKFRKIAMESIDTRMKPSKVERIELSNLLPSKVERSCESSSTPLPSIKRISKKSRSRISLPKKYSDDLKSV